MTSMTLRPGSQKSFSKAFKNLSLSNPLVQERLL